AVCAIDGGVGAVGAGAVDGGVGARGDGGVLLGGRPPASASTGSSRPRRRRVPRGAPPSLEAARRGRKPVVSYLTAGGPAQVSGRFRRRAGSFAGAARGRVGSGVGLDVDAAGQRLI